MKLAQAYLKLEHVSPRKAGLVADLIRYRPVAEALTVLEFTEKKTAPILAKLLNSAIANAVNNAGMNVANLYVIDVQVMKGTTLKRFQPHGRGRATPILKRTSQFLIRVGEVDEKGEVK